MGTPATVFPEPNGGTLLAYPRGPMGLQTFMVRIDENGRFVSNQQVLDEKHFADVKRGIGPEAVSRLLGPPFQTVAFERRHETAWDYRYRDTWGYVSVFSVIFSEDGKVKTTVNVREEPRFGFPFF
jgi:hypothetical protein